MCVMYYTALNDSDDINCICDAIMFMI